MNDDFVHERATNMLVTKFVVKVVEIHALFIVSESILDLPSPR